MQFTMTQEQRLVVESSAKTLAVDAFAGCTKTTTLVFYAQARPNKRFLYLAFNASVKEAAKEKFPSNVRVVTTHGLAYGKTGKDYARKLGNPRASDIVRVFDVPHALAGQALAIIKAWLCDVHAEIDERSVSDEIPAAAREAALELARKTWVKMMNTRDKSVFMSHDGYLKLYQISRPMIDNIDGILFDEFQDANPLALDIVSRQTCDKLYVGDRHQAIYAFRGAVNALERLKTDERLSLTGSFRFGAGIASLASALLQTFAGEDKDVRGLSPHKTKWTVDRKKPYTIIGRTNAGIFDAAVKAIKEGRRICFCGGVDSYRLDTILDAYHLYAGTGAVRDRMLASFSTWAEMKEYAETVNDRELKSLVRTVESYGRGLPGLISWMRSKAESTPTGKDITLSTVHKAKGLEYDQVVMLDDFADLDDEVPREEVHLHYVALTRAIHSLEPNNQLLAWLATARPQLHAEMLASRTVASAKANSTAANDGRKSSMRHRETA